MNLESGTRLGSYLVSSKLGAGGMGVVYRARDSVLGREVAIKILPRDVAADRERIARFEREARLLASLNHPNIATIHGLEVHDGARFLVLELVEGRTLASLLERGPLPVEQCVKIATQIAAALEAAHQRGVLHRDLKPGNVMVTREGTLKLLDFGLAVPFAHGGGPSDLTDSPTLTENLTRTGFMVGTAAYMSPEQVRGRDLDRRTDLWSFGCVLYQMLTGRSPFAADTLGDTLATILEREPDWSLLPRDVPSRIRLLLQRCLRKDLSERQRDAGDASLDLKSDDASVPPGSVGRSGAIRWMGPIVGLLAGFILATLMAIRTEPGPESGGSRPSRLAVPVDDGTSIALSDRSPIALSPDGARLAYVARAEEGNMLRLREIDSFEGESLAGTEGATGPFFSPDGEWLGFFEGFRLLKVSVSGAGTRVLTTTSPITRGAAWGPDGVIRFTLSKVSGVVTVGENGSDLRALTSPSLELSEILHSWPQLLPGSSKILVTIRRTGDETYDDADIVVIDPATSERKILIDGGYYGRYLSSGYLVYVRNGELLGLPFDRDRLEVSGSPVRVLGGFLTDPEIGWAAVDISDNGTLAYLPGGVRPSTGYSILRVDRDGTETLLSNEARNYRYPRISPDGRTLAVTIEETSDDLYALDISRRTLRRLTFDGRNFSAVWAPDGESMVFCRTHSNAAPTGFRLKLADGGAPERIIEGRMPQCPDAFSPDGKALAFTRWTLGSQLDLRVTSMGSSDSEPVAATRFDEKNASISPDGAWIAYVTNESGRDEVYVQRLDRPGGKTRISTSGGVFPVWAPGGRELLYRSDDRLMAVPVETGEALVAGEPRVVLRGYPQTGFAFGRDYDVSPDGLWFVMIRQAEELPSIREIRVVIDWFDELETFFEGGEQR